MAGIWLGKGEKCITMRDGAVVARRAHNPKVIGSSPVPATKKRRYKRLFCYVNVCDDLKAFFQRKVRSIFLIA
jgi:hypothetical protein